MIQLNKLSKRYGEKKLFQQATVNFTKNNITILLGENGAGKSTLLQILAGLEKADDGEILYNNDLKSVKELKEIVGYVPQDIALWEHLSIKENLHFFKGLIKKSISQEQVDAYCQQLNLKDFNQSIDKLSGGTKRKVNIIVGLLGNPELLILDEPTVGIDLKSRMEIHQLLKELKSKCTIIMTTHYMEEIESIADEVVVIGQDHFYRDLLEEKNREYRKI